MQKCYYCVIILTKLIFEIFNNIRVNKQLPPYQLRGRKVRTSFFAKTKKAKMSWQWVTPTVPLLSSSGIGKVPQRLY